MTLGYLRKNRRIPMENKPFVERVELEIEHVIMGMGYVALGDDYQIIKKSAAKIAKIVEEMLPEEDKCPLHPEGARYLEHITCPRCEMAITNNKIIAELRRRLKGGV